MTEWPSVHDYGRKPDPDAEIVARVAKAISKERDGTEIRYQFHEAEARVFIAAFNALKIS